MPFVGLIIKNVPLAPAIIKYLRSLTDPTRSACIVLPYLFVLHARRRLKLPVVCQHASTFEQSTGFCERQYKCRRLWPLPNVRRPQNADRTDIADGRLGLSLRHAQRRANLRTFLPKNETNASPTTGYSSAGVESESESDSEWMLDVPIPTRLCIVIQVVGSRGDVQPFVALGLTLHRKYGHRVRIATHGVFQRFVEQNDLEFFDIGGDPEELMAFMVRNPGLLPSYSSLRNGDVKQQRANMRAILDGCWRSCVQPTCGRPFIADAIIANPPSFAHIHCAEKLGIPLHLMFT